MYYCSACQLMKLMLLIRMEFVEKPDNIVFVKIQCVLIEMIYNSLSNLSINKNKIINNNNNNNNNNNKHFHISAY